MIAGSPLHLALADRAQPRARRSLLRDRQRARGDARRAVVAGTGAALAGLRAAARPRRGARRAFLATGLVSAFVFAAGRFGADVGAAIVLPLGAAVAAAALAAAGAAPRCSCSPRRSSAVALLALVDLLSGANAHLTRSVLDAGGLGDLGRRRPAPPAALRPQLRQADRLRLPAAARRPRRLALAAPRPAVEAWLRGAPAMRAGLLGAVAADPRRHPGQRLRRPAAGDRLRLPAGLRRLRLGRERATRKVGRSLTP